MIIDIERWYRRCLLQLEINKEGERADTIRNALCLFAEHPSWLAFAIVDSGWREHKIVLDGLYSVLKIGGSINAPVSSNTQLVAEIQAALMQNENTAPVFPISIRYGQRLTVNTLDFLSFLGFIASPVEALQYTPADNEDQLQYTEADFEDISHKVERGDFEDVESIEQLARSYSVASFNKVKSSTAEWIDKLVAGDLIAKPINEGSKALCCEIIAGLVLDNNISADALYNRIAHRLIIADGAGHNDGNLSARKNLESSKIPSLVIIKYKVDGSETYVKSKTFANWVSQLRNCIPVASLISNDL
jgi:hypothetical protein